MERDQLKEQYLPLLREHALPLVLGVLGISFIGYGLMQSLVIQRDSSEITFESGEVSANAQTKTAHKEIIVDVEGAVLKPGIHKLPADSRVQDALIAAGGMSEKADRMKVAKGMNLAAKVMDGGKIYIPFEGDVAGVSVGQGTGSTVESGVLQNVNSAGVNINTANESELDSLSGVGPATAQKIIRARPYASVEELLTKKAVGKSVFEKIKDKVSVN